MTSKLTIYCDRYAGGSSAKPFLLQPEKLFEVENIDNYLAQFTSYSFEIQFFKPKLRTTIKLPLDQQNVWNFSTTTYSDYYKYCVVQQNYNLSQSRKIYYFIQEFKWVAGNCVELELMLDVLNTLKYGLDYSYNPKTTVIREHVDRFEIIELPDDKTAFFPVVDKINEEINPTLWGRYIGNFTDGTNQHWNLVYRNVNDPTDSLVNPVECFLVPDNDTTVKINSLVTTAGKITASMLTANVVYCIAYNCTGNSGDVTDKIQDASGNTIVYYDTGGTDNRWYLFFYRDGNKIIYWFISNIFKYLSASVGGGYTYSKQGSTDFLLLDGFTSVYYKIANTYPSFLYGLSTTTNINDTTFASRVDSILSTEYLLDLSTGDGQRVIKGINAWDKTDAKIIKIIKCPYLPDGFTITGGVPAIPNDYQYTTINGNACLKLIDLNKKFWNSSVSLSNGDPIAKMVQSYSVYRTTLVDTTIKPILDITQTGGEKWLDPKLYASEFYMPKFSYDSFSVAWLLENVDIASYCHDDDTYSTTLGVIYITTSTINSRFAFEFQEYGNELDLMDNDYPSFIVASRNNEVTLYNVPYINYIRNGYNYDVKNKNQANLMNWIPVGVGLGATALNFAFGGGTFAVPMAISTGASTVMSLSNAISSTVKNERTMAEKLDALKQQSATVLGSDDLDILERYNGNYLRAYEYKPNDEVTTLVNKYFFYTGYKRKRLGIPNRNTRYRFNFIQVEPVLDMPYFREMSKEIYDELVRIMRTGYTIIHYRANDTTTKWDFNQEYNNVENSLLGD